MEIKIPSKVNDTLKLYVNDVYKGDVDVNQANQIRINVVTEINKSNDTSILDNFYFIGHETSNDVPGKEIKITMDEVGNFSNMPYEFDHVRRALVRLIDLERNKYKK